MTSTTPRNPLILDTDGGVDDAQALLLLLSHGIVPQAITTVFGNVSLDAATRNILDVLALAKSGVPVFKGQARPLIAPVIDAAHIHGSDGLGNAPRPPQAAKAQDRGAVEYLIETLSAAAKSGNQVDLLMIGPFTNLAVALRLAPDIIAGIGHLWIMGATLYGRGNTTPAAEFNVMADPEAAQIVFTAGIPTTIAPWEVCASHAMDITAIDALIDALPDTPLAKFNAHLMLHAREVNRGYGGAGHFQFVDPLAAAVLIDPSLITTSVTASTDVALDAGITRGMTLVDLSGRLGTPPVTFVETAKLDSICTMFETSAHWAP